MIKTDANGDTNADIAVRELRKLQELFFRHDVTDMDLFNRTNEVINIMQLAAKDIRANFEDISKDLTDMMNGKPRNKENKQ